MERIHRITLRWKLTKTILEISQLSVKRLQYHTHLHQNSLLRCDLQLPFLTC